MASGGLAPVIPADGPAYDIENETFQRLWSDDADSENLSLDDFDGDAESKSEFIRRLTRSTDTPFEQPPRAVEQWNRGDFDDYSPGDRTTSVHPASASLSDGTVIKDAFVSIFAVQPSTVLHHRTGTTQHVAPDGDVLALSDYRVVIPEGDDTGLRREKWSLKRTSTDITLSAGDRTHDTGRGHTATLDYAGLSGSPEVTVTAEITAEFDHHIRECEDWNRTLDTCRGGWETETHHPSFSKTVSTSRDVVVNRLDGVSGSRVGFDTAPSRTGAVVSPATPWTTIAVADDTRIRSNWWFYSAGTPGWRTMESDTATGSSRAASSVRPLQVHAYPSKMAPSVPSESETDRHLTIEKTWGPEQAGPSLPPNVDLDTADPYTHAESVAVSSETLDGEDFREVEVHGIVRGQSRTVSLSSHRTVRETNLTLAVVESNATHATVLASVANNATGDPVTTGRVEIESQTTTLNSSGEGVVTLTNPPALVRGQYDPTEWWRTTEPHAAAVDVTKVPGNYPEPETLIDLTVVTLLWFLPAGLAVVGFDYITGGDLLGFIDP
ncbi:hypothetical protein C453_01200 [Haloferax elongans ATCC BAA-1513]|uniref:Uncharacterized protein n=2 Tax=Haloferax elongans TaxID=403191 RepID=M0HYR0_HALEO|nr:hypothetical protein C453_01200 [Haloferax elongans ATCC BAA-1513]